jgi:hypothetical protein
MAIAELLSLFREPWFQGPWLFVSGHNYGRRRTRQPQVPVWANFSSLYGLVEFGNRSRQERAAHESGDRAYRVTVADS